MIAATRPRRLPSAVVAGLVAAAVLAGCGGAQPTALDAPTVREAAAATGVSTRYVPITPTRVLDTRSDPVRHRLGAHMSMSLAPVTDAVLGASATSRVSVQAVVLNLTMVDAGAAGFASVWPTGSLQPTVSSVNTDVTGQTVANMVTVPVGVDGYVSVYSSIDADFIVDVQGVYESATSATAGRFVPLTPRRAIDTRRTSPLAADSAITVDVSAAGVPKDASAAVLNVTATETEATGYLTVWAADTPRPLASNLNVPRAGFTVANQVIAGVTAGRVNVYTHGATDVLVDVTGYLTGAAAASGTDGLFVPITPARLLDTRTPGPEGGGAPLGAGGTITLPIDGRGGVPAGGAAAVALNVTATRSRAPGYVTAWPAGTALPDTSTLNVVAAGRTVPNHAVTPLHGGAVSLYSFGGTDLLVDVMGYWTGFGSMPPATPGGQPVTAGTITPPPTTAPPAAPTTDGTYSFLYQVAPKSILAPYGRWNPCAPIRYAANVDRATQAMVDEMNAAIAEVELATGLDFVYVGATSAGLDFVPPPGADAVIGFSDQSATPHLAGGVIGIGGGNYDASSGEVLSGFALADVDGIQSPTKLRATLMHEIAHMVGLDHVNDAAQLMYASVTAISTFGGGDRRGLWFVGAAQGCVADRAADTRSDGTILVVAVD